VVGAQEDGMSRRWKSYTEDEEAIISSMWEGGASVAEIAEALDRTELGVYGYISKHRHMYSYREPRVSHQEHEQMLALREQGKTYVEIGRYLGVSDQTVKRHVRIGWERA
jgi:DNA-binding CsgD family transcriptional regulator